MGFGGLVGDALELLGGVGLGQGLGFEREGFVVSGFAVVLGELEF